MRLILYMLLIYVLAAPLSACGKKASIEPPPGTKKTDYPRSYPG